MVDWTTIVASVGLSVLGSIALTEYRLKREKSIEEATEIEEWYNTSAKYAAEVRRNWQRLFDSAENPKRNLSEIQNEMSLMENQISRHATEGERLDVDERVIETLDELAEECRQPANKPLHLNSASDFVDFREDILEAVEKVEEALQER